MSNLAKLQALQQSDNDKRKDTWNTIKETDPQLAQLMLDINQIMGKPEFIDVVINDKVVLKQGQEQGVRDMSVKVNGRRW